MVIEGVKLEDCQRCKREMAVVMNDEGIILCQECFDKESDEK